MTSPVEYDVSRAKRSLFETSQPTADTTSGSDTEQVKVSTADDGLHGDNGRPVTCRSTA